MLKTELILTINAPTPKKKFRTEKECYPYVKKTLAWRKSFKFYSMVLRGLPDFIVTAVDLYPLKAGFYEVKFNDRQLTPYQIKMIRELTAVANCYLARCYADGKIEVYKVERRGDEGKNDTKQRGD